MRTYAVNPVQMSHILAALMPQNRLIVRLCCATGLRVSDALSLRRFHILSGRPTITEQKTGKKRRLYIPKDLRADILAQSGDIWAFESRTDPTKHKTRQAVYKDIKHAQSIFARAGTIEKGRNLGTHTARKTAAVQAYQSGGMDAAQKLLLHSDPAITALYALSYELPKEGKKNVKKRRLDTN